MKLCHCDFLHGKHRNDTGYCSAAYNFATGALRFDPEFIFRSFPMRDAAKAFALYKDPTQVHGKIMLVND